MVVLTDDGLTFRRGRPILVLPPRSGHPGGPTIPAPVTQTDQPATAPAWPNHGRRAIGALITASTLGCEPPRFVRCAGAQLTM